MLKAAFINREKKTSAANIRLNVFKQLNNRVYGVIKYVLIEMILIMKFYLSLKRF